MTLPIHQGMPCRNGHPRTPENTRIVKTTGKRVCAPCQKASKRRYQVLHWDRVAESFRKYREDHLERVREVNRETTRRIRQTERGVIAKRAHQTVARAVKAGRLERRPCQECGAERSQGHHHRGYDFPLDVIWLCAHHHGEAHSVAG